MSRPRLAVSSRSRAGEILFFLHIPKTAGSTMQWVLHRQYADHTCDLPEYSIRHGILYYPGRPTGFFKPADNSAPAFVVQGLRSGIARAVLGHFAFGLHRDATGSATYMTFLREPVARVSSLYYHLRRWRAFEDGEWFPGESDRRFTDATTLEEFVTKYRLRELDNDQTRRVSGLEPEYGACSSALLDVAKRNIQNHFAVVGLTERFDESLAVAAETLGWTSDIGYVRRLVNEHRPSVTDISPLAREAILERNELDAHLYQFAEKSLREAIGGLGPRFQDRLREIRAMTRELARIESGEGRPGRPSQL